MKWDSFDFSEVGGHTGSKQIILQTKSAITERLSTGRHGIMMIFPTMVGLFW